MASLETFTIEPFFLEGSSGNLFAVLYTPPANELRGAVVYLPPFAEEMHKSRRVAAVQARTLAVHGFAVLQADLYGCGDSEGDFSDARWEIWKADAVQACTWLQRRFQQPVSLWGLRTGALLAAETAQEIPGLTRLLLWQPVPNGEQFLNQFLRLVLARDLLGGGESRTGVRDLRRSLASGETLEVGGYEITPELAEALSNARLDRSTPPCPIDWIEVVPEADQPVTPASARVMDAWKGKGMALQALTVTGETFWQTQEITECPAIIEATLAAMGGALS